MLEHITEKIENNIRLTEEDAVSLFYNSDLLEIGVLADRVNRRKNHGAVFYNVNRHINPTNICALSCKFCAYSRKPGQEGAYAYSIDEILVKAGEAVEQGATEVHMVGGLHPRWGFQHYKDMIAAVKQRFPALHIKAFTAVELDWLARKARKSVHEVLEELRAVGLGSLPGGGAEIFHPEVRDVICDTKVSAEQWLDTHRSAHSLGMMSNCTMLYGHIESYEHRVDHMSRLRKLQDETHGFNAFIPLSFQPHQNQMGIKRYTFGFDDLKTIAIARLFLDNFQHIKAYWIMLGQDIAQLALQFGANDLDGTVLEEKISRMAGGRAGMGMTKPFIEKIIAKAGRYGIERDTLYNPVNPEWFSLKQQESSANLAESRSADQCTAFELGKKAQKLAQNFYEYGNCHYHPAYLLNNSLISANEVHKTDNSSEGARSESLLKLHHAIVSSTTAVVDYDQLADQAPTLCELLSSLGRQHDLQPQQSIVWRGITKLLSQHAEENDNQASDSQLCASLVAAGVGTLVMSYQDALMGLGFLAPSFLDSLTAHGLKLHLRVLLREQDQHIDWQGFLEQIIWIKELQKTHNHIDCLIVDSHHDDLISASEYMKAVAFTRWHTLEALDPSYDSYIPKICCPVGELKTLSPTSGMGSLRGQHPAEKFAASALHYGANDLGLIFDDTLNLGAIIEQIRSVGFTPVLLTTSQQKAPTNTWDELQVFLDTRHLPSLAVSEI